LKIYTVSLAGGLYLDLPVAGCCEVDRTILRMLQQLLCTLIYAKVCVRHTKSLVFTII